MLATDDERRCVCSSADGSVRCSQEWTRDGDLFCDPCRDAKEGAR